MNKKQIISDMKQMVGNKDPILYFEKMTDLFEALSNQLDGLEKDLDKVKTNSALAIEWDPQVANDLLSHQIEVLRADKELYHEQLSEVKRAYAEGIVTQEYKTFVSFWLDTLGYHPFLNYKK